MPEGVLILVRKDIQGLLTAKEHAAAVEEAFRLHAEGKSLSPGVLDVEAPDGVFHIKAAGLALHDRIYVAVKVNGNYPGNHARFGLPTIQGTITLCDGTNGSPLAVLDSTEITAQRTAAATAVAAKYLARPDSRSVTICGCGRQGRVQLLALLPLFPLRQVFAFDSNDQAAVRFTREVTEQTGVSATVVSEPGDAARRSDIVVTCTTSRKYFLRNGDVGPGAFVAAVGADSPHKQELDPRLLAASKVVADIRDQCAVMGDLHHAIREQLMTPEDVHAELGEIVAGRKPARASNEEIIIFDSTGTAIQDVAAAAAIYRKAVERGIGFRCELL